MTRTTHHSRIAIVGAGSGGLTCARILQRHGIPVTVYDRDVDESARDQGGSLDLHPDDGQRALREAGLLDDFFALARFEAQEMRQLSTSDGAVVNRVMPDADESSAPEIDRGQLRTMLLRSLQPATVEWDRGVMSVSGPDAGPRTLHFSDGSSAEADLVVGADGAHSRVRRAVSEAEAQYSGVDFLEAWFDDVTTRHAELAQLVGQGSAVVSDSDGAMWAQRNSGDHMRVYVVRRRPLGWMAQHGLSSDDTDGIRALLLREFCDWSPAVLRFITDNDGPYVDRPLFVLPAPHTWRRSPSITLLGDAAHLMPPVGVGVNLAMLDGCELALALVRSPDTAAAIRLYEDTMLPRSIEHALAADGHADFLLDDEGLPGGPGDLSLQQ